MSYEGYWISPDGEEYEVVEHLLFVKKNPELFGLDKEDVEGLSEKDRDWLFPELMKAGWVRVRGRKDSTSIEFWRLNRKIAGNIRKFFDRHKFWDEDVIFFSELYRNDAGYYRVADIRSETFIEERLKISSE